MESLPLVPPPSAGSSVGSDSWVTEKRIKKAPVKLESGISSQHLGALQGPSKKPRSQTKPKTAKPHALSKAASSSVAAISNGKSSLGLLQSIIVAPPKKKEDVWVPPSVALSARDRAPQLLLSQDQMEVTGVTGGYRLVRATHGVHNGAYYWEAEILEVPEGGNPNSHVRVGWTTRQGDLQASVGNDAHGYGYRDTSGSKCHKGVRDDSYGTPYGPADVVGCFLNLDVENVNNNQMRFFLNGMDQGVAYRGKEIPLGVYFPACSLYMNSRVRVNYGPSFILRHDIYNANAVSEVQPMNPDDRKSHDVRIAGIRENNAKVAALLASSAPNKHVN